MARLLACFALFVVLVPGLALAADAPRTTPDPITVQLMQNTPLRLARFKFDRKDKGAVALDGSLSVTVTNRSADQPVFVLRREVHGFVFRPKGGGAPFVFVHPCKCVKDFQDEVVDVTPLRAAGHETVVYDDWGCSGSTWPPPPASTYLVSYRTFAFDHVPEKPELPDAPASPQQMVEACRKALADEASWVGAIESNALEVTLVPPVDLLYDAKGERWVEQKSKKKAKVR